MSNHVKRDGTPAGPAFRRGLEGFRQIEREARLEAEARALERRLEVAEREERGLVHEARELLLSYVRDVVQQFPHDGGGDVGQLFLELETLLGCGHDPRDEDAWS